MSKFEGVAVGMVPYINGGHGDTPMPGFIMAISPGTCVDTEEECSIVIRSSLYAEKVRRAGR